MKHIYAFVIKATAGAAILLLAAAILVVEPRESVGQGSGIITDCASTSCAACLPDSTTKQCVNSAKEVNGSCASGANCPDCTCGTTATKDCTCK